ncbi:hypothetical protein, partial [Klebsiella pneumoniae]|uniref:hypothetical protein n=1 Tax=Klebsiella pneumoniae TaxID=573 RepID=UPI003013A7C5
SMAEALPMPDVLPVIKTTLSFNFPMMLHSSFEFCPATSFHGGTTFLSKKDNWLRKVITRTIPAPIKVVTTRHTARD